MAICCTHPMDSAVGVCRGCNVAYCSECLVYPFGERKPPLCVGCALQASGIRSSHRRPISSLLGRR
jgi:hypothetical protein